MKLVRDHQFIRILLYTFTLLLYTFTFRLLTMARVRMNKVSIQCVPIFFVRHPVKGLCHSCPQLPALVITRIIIVPVMVNPSVYPSSLNKIMVLMLKYYYHCYAYFLLINYSYLLAVLNRKLVLVLESSNVRIKFLTDFFSFLFSSQVDKCIC